MRILHLTLKKQYFDDIIAGEKKEEYREVKPYWAKSYAIYALKKELFLKKNAYFGFFS